ncbi:FGGY-family carbohydrate kinase [uncultured Sphaerochaeta sp.]|uniref:FGGY-family carbohydrate kinase n=1 Tax=uncultured Sphaerochaeta sp. TaxID=886478 RepID=UPI002A0A22AB|nr:FGGY-family carbohydrate kinase [uncultured Sphaerochaeta sp.]
MKQKAALEVDIGISTVHAVVVSLVDGTLIAQKEVGYEWDVMENDRGEINPNKIWEISQKAVEAVLETLDYAKVRIEVLAFSCFGDCFVGVDENGEPVYPMLAFSDLRAIDIVDELNSLIKGKPYAQITGGPLIADYVFPKMYWMKKHLPQIYGRIDSFYNIQQFMLRKLGLSPLTDYSMAARKMMFDVKSHSWASELCEILEKDPDCFGKAAEATTIVGKINRYGRVALPYEIQVVLGAHDAQCGYMGLGVKENNTSDIIANNAGTYNLFGTLSAKSIVFDSAMITPGCGPTINSFHYQAGAMIGPTLNWFTSNVAKSNLANLFEKAVFDATCNIRMVNDPLTGNGMFEGISLRDDTTSFFTGLIESITFPMRDWLDAMREASQGVDGFKCVRIGAGGAKSPAWIQLKADILGIPFERVENLQTSSVGLAMICAVATGVYPDYDAASENMIRVNRVFEPDLRLNQNYLERYFDFKQRIQAN